MSKGRPTYSLALYKIKSATARLFGPLQCQSESRDVKTKSQHGATVVIDATGGRVVAQEDRRA